MRILILNFILSTSIDGKIIRRDSNADTMIYTVARGFVKLGHSVTLAAADEFRPLKPEQNSFDVVYFKSRLPHIFKPYLLPYPIGLGKYLRKNIDNFDMILSVDVFSIPTLIAAYNLRSKLIIWQEMAFFQHMMGGIPAKIWYKLIAPRFIKDTPIVCQSEHAKKFISRFHHNVSEQIIGHGADSDTFYPADKSEDYFIIISMLVYRKRIDRILEKFAQFLNNTSYNTYTLRIIGDGPESENLKKRANELGISEHVKFLGFLPHCQIAELSRKAKALLIDTQQDNNMVTITESIANGTPVLTNMIPNNASVIKKYNLGIAKDSWDWQDLKNMIRYHDIFHQSCIDNRNLFTNEGCANALIDDYN